LYKKILIINQAPLSGFFVYRQLGLVGCNIAYIKSRIREDKFEPTVETRDNFMRFFAEHAAYPAWLGLQLASEIPIRTEMHLYDLEKANEALRDLKSSKFSRAAVLYIG
jgi:hypothetical protein